MLNSMRLGISALRKNLPMAAPLASVNTQTVSSNQTTIIVPNIEENVNFGNVMFMPFPLEMNDFILKLSTFKRKKLKIKKDRAKTIRKRLKRKSLRKRARYQLD